LPPKTLTSWFSKVALAGGGGGGSNNAGSVEFVEERRHALERYIQAMIVSDDGRWRASQALQRFLAPAEDSGAWLGDQRGAEQMLREVRQSILRRENALARNEVSASHQSLLHAKRQLADLARLLKALELRLEQLRPALTAGEMLRRQDMLMRLAEENANLSQLVAGDAAVGSGRTDRAALLGSDSSTRLIARAAGAASPAHRPPPPAPPATAPAAQRPAPRSRRVFGNVNPPQETNETRGLDAQGLLMLQTERMREQDHVAAEFSALLRRQREMGESIGNELDLQNHLLTDLDHDMDRTATKLAAAKRQASNL
ncbi:hypothetical protein GGI02_005655, partial [Coemansia sp. RSA 2322]